MPIDALGRREAAADVVGLAMHREGGGLDVHLCNAYTLALADSDQRLREILRAAGRNYPDGMSVVWANRWLHGDVPAERVYGPDLMLDVMDEGRSSGLRHYLLGSTPEVLDGLRRNLETRFPGVDIVGSESPPFRDLTPDEHAAQADRLRAARPHVVWVGLGTPKQDLVAADLAGRAPCVFVAVGAAFDFIAGTKRQAPVWMQRHGLEWLYRLASEPRRLWRRYLVGNVHFVVAAVRHRPRRRG